ncbi:ATP-binding protein [Terasakiella sp. A23]|uniref:ATP-binding protein n=1 Tax=Terasakiella sp. FCG-A23 TaxID=3080561 RepID=UPI002954C880|nr:ATP-binding protein [Terasakiella sp. A23]MDV7341831.1 ATP-binding protein [Terasakiella sp. A23]
MAKFRARARTIDMLGRQQIQGIPTALHELFKNAHDAYADEVEVDFYRKSNILLIRDDGIGMTQEDFESRWLVLGTESKLDGGDSESLRDPDKEARAVLGEKGIGRLAIATIGPEVLIMTRAKRRGNVGPVTVAFINWGMYELPGVDLDEVEVPLKEFPSVEEITNASIDAMIQGVKDNLKAIQKKTDPKIVARIQSELDQFRLPVNKITSLSYGPTLQSDEKGGTHFFISPVSEGLIHDIEEGVGKVRGLKGATNLQRMLLGFSNTMRKDADIPITTEFRDHLLDGQVIQRAGSQEFFTPEEFDIADHHIEGSFDKFGNFTGTLKIYGGAPQTVEIIYNTSQEPLASGPFKLEFSYVQGDKKQSLVPASEHTSLTKKLDTIGGLYIYNNGIRVLPYGNSDYDFLEIERRRTLGAAHYFFSYRRMFGAIFIDSTSNPDLHEKAGREGFQNNKAYRQFRLCLMNFFEQLAAKYFRAEGVYADEWAEKRSSLEREYAIAQKRKQRATNKKNDLKNDLSNFFDMLAETSPSDVFDDICEDTRQRLNNLINEFSLEEIASEIIELEANCAIELKEALSPFIVKRPKAVGLTKTLERDWRYYESTFAEKVLPEYQLAQKFLDEIVGGVAKDAKIHLDTRARLQASIKSVREYNFKQVEAERSQIRETLTSTEKYVKEQLKESRVSLEETQLHIEKQIIAADFETMDQDSLNQLRQDLESQLDDVSLTIKRKLETIKGQLHRVNENSEDAELASDDAIAAMETELEILKDDYNDSLDMAQLGMAVGVIHHEFEANIRGVRRSLHQLQKWASANEGLQDLYLEMRKGFDHLDNYLSLFTPLDKRLRRRRTNISGEAVSDFVKDLFGERMERHEVELQTTDAFLQQKVSNFASVIYPVFVNVVDNAIFWLKTKNGIRTVTLEATTRGFKISDNGPGISAKDLPHIFDFGYSRRYGGRGMGLYIAKTSLNKDGWDIKVDPDNSSGASFIIEPLEETE